MISASAIPTPASRVDVLEMIETFAAAWGKNDQDLDAVIWTGDMMELSFGYSPKLVGTCCLRGFFLHRQRATTAEEL